MSGKRCKVRKLKGHEIFHEIAQSEYKSMITCYWLVLQSQKEVSGDQVQEALTILFRNVDILRLFIKKENDEYWFYKMEEERIPLEVLKNECPNEVFHKEMHNSIDSASGPLWRAKYIMNDKLEERNNNFISDIIFSFNHAITDGFTVFNICNGFLKVLNDVIGGKIQNSYNFGQHDEGRETEELTEKRLEFLKENPDQLAQVKKLVTDMTSQNVRFTEFFPVPDGTPKKTKHIYRELDEETNKKILNVFKSKGISFHSGFTAVANWVLMELFTENNLNDEEIDITAFHMINMRRYWKKSSTAQLGPHVSSLRILSKTDKNVGANFWQYAREFGKALKSGIDKMEGIDTQVAFMLSNPERSDMAFADLFTKITAPSAYYVTTNMGDLSSILQGRGDHVSIKWLARCTSAEMMNTIMTHIFQTYEGKFLYGLGYSTHLMTDEFANTYVDRIIDKLKLLSNLQ
ncbi:hypothetical protein Avbf_17700 [Armadillidium vulgare]|nr:hypothetical protein Avbf_17700 [Armadillidium vulgare]